MQGAWNMKRGLCFVMLLLCCPLANSAAELLKWDGPNKSGEVKAFVICAVGPLPAATIRKVTVWTNELDLTYLLKNAPQGRYAVYGMTLGTNDVLSEKSKAVAVYWNDGKIFQETPSGVRLPATFLGCQNLAFSHEAKGVVYQTGQDAARIYSATACQSIAAGPICKVALNLRKLHEPKSQLRVSVWSNFKNRPAALLATGAAAIDLSQITDGWYEVPLSFNALAGETYWVGYSLSNADAKNGVLWLGGGPGARCYSGDGITWVYAANEALNVRLYK
jgi:hypothetical protein